MELYNYIVEYYQKISGFNVAILALLGIVSKSYFAEKGKLKAQISENKKLIEQSETIKLKFNKELEELKKEHQLEISKRKYQYESKKEQYLKFFRLLDEFTKENNLKIQERFFPILDEFNKNYINAAASNNKKNEANSLIIFQKKIQKLMFDSSQDLMRIKQETNSIRLVASVAILQKLDLLTSAYDKSMEVSNKIILSNNQDTMKDLQLELETVATVINNIKYDIIHLMRNELDEI
jgi:hypothetical protein